MFDKLRRDIRIALKALFFGMKGANDLIATNTDMDNQNEINVTIGIGGVFADMLQEKETQQVKETRDSYYRVLNEADKLHTEIDPSCLDENGNIIRDMKAKSRRKTASDFSKHTKVYEGDGLKLRVIQDNKQIQKESNFNYEAVSNSNLSDFDTTLTINRDGFIPNFFIEKFVNKIVVKNIDDKNAVIELYAPTEAGRFNKLEGVFVTFLNRVFNKQEKKLSTFDCTSMEFVSDKAWNSDDLCLFKYDNIKYDDIYVFDGHFVLKFTANIVSDGELITKKFETKELTEKYEKQETKQDAVDIFTLSRHIKNNEITNLGTTKLTLNDEDCN